MYDSDEYGITIGWTVNANAAEQQICASTGNTLNTRIWDQDVSPSVPYNPPCA